MINKNLNNKSAKISNRQIIKTSVKNNFFRKNFYNEASNNFIDHDKFLTPERTVRNINAVSLKLYNHNDILQDSCGEITSAETLHFRTTKPIEGGLYCEKIFGGIDNYACSCGKFVGFMYDGITCDVCGVKIQKNDSRYYSFGHINFPLPIMSPLFYTRDSIVLYLLKINFKTLTQIVQYQTRFIAEVENGVVSYVKIDNENIYYDFFEENEEIAFTQDNLIVGYGAAFLYKVLELIDLDNVLASKVNIKTDRIYTLLTQFNKSGNLLTDIVINSIMVLPAALRPIKRLTTTHSSVDSNQFYKVILIRNEKLKLYLSSPPMLIPHEMKIHAVYQLQKIVIAFFDQGEKAFQYVYKNKLLKPIFDILIGKSGLLRNAIAGKRSNFSGRAVLTVDGKYKINECGIPYKMCLDIFKSHIIGNMIKANICNTVSDAITIIENSPYEILNFVKDTLKGQTIIINRNPTLHRQGIQSLQFEIIFGLSVCISPSICAGFNADVDGDSLALFSNLYPSSLLESYLLMDASKNIFSLGNGKCLALPNREIKLGAHIATYPNSRCKTINLINKNQVLQALQYNKIKYYDMVSFYLPDIKKNITCSAGLVKFNELLPIELRDYQTFLSNEKIENNINKLYQSYGFNTTANYLHSFQKESLDFVTKYGYTLSIADLNLLMDKSNDIRIKVEEVKEILVKINNIKIHFIAKDILRRYFTGLLLKLTSNYIKTNVKSYDNNLSLSITSKARGNFNQVMQIAGLIGFIGDAEGNILPIPILNNYLLGLNSIEYFLTSFGTISGVVERGLSTKIAGYETRKLVYALSNSVITSLDCGIEYGEQLDDLYDQASGDNFVSKYERIIGRVLAENINNYKINTLITKSIAYDLKSQNINPKVFLLFNCQMANNQYCQKCYGADLSTKEMVDIGELVGLIASQSIGEPSLQMTMRTFHNSGVIERENNMVKLVINTLDKESIISYDESLCTQYANNIIINNKELVIYMDNKEFCVLPALSCLFVNNKSKISIQDHIALIFKNSTKVYSKTKGTLTEDNTLYYLVDSNQKKLQTFKKENTMMISNVGDIIQFDQFIGLQYQEEQKGSIISDITQVVNIINLQGEYHDKTLTVTPIKGQVTINIINNKYKITIVPESENDNPINFTTNFFSDILVEDGQKVEIFDQIIKGPINIFTYNEVYGPDIAKRYMVKLISSIFLNSNIYFDSKHLEILTNTMFGYGEITNNQGERNYNDKSIYNISQIKDTNHIRSQENLPPIIYNPTIRSINVLASHTKNILSAISFNNSKKLLIKYGLTGKKTNVTNVLESYLVGNILPFGSNFSFSDKIKQYEINRFISHNKINKFLFAQECIKTLKLTIKDNVNLLKDNYWYKSIIELTTNRLKTQYNV